jgi:hypothetical protein
MINNKFKFFIIYVLGIATPLVLVGVLSVSGVQLNKNKIETALTKWRVDECNDSLLFVNIQAAPYVWFAIGIHRDPNTRFLQKIGITKESPNLSGALFAYRLKGKYGFPEAFYGYPNEYRWVDLNGDGRFDEFDEYKKEMKNINLNGQWISGIGKLDVQTKSGMYRFDPNAGEWKIFK